ncbi:replication protein A 70 kDa DNA-binding subunit C-like protein [Tanacetum coccineum]|uniref:Replication protein A 70 kDa DNA-binding subunit C-like protein n=1 Tax=Tanacetum coccineum TaxID=301880 RepID=A0ABQ4Y129_9ASTR
MSTKAIVGKSDAQNNKHVSDEAAGSKHPTSHAKLGPEIEIMIHCSAWASVAHNFLRLKEGRIYSMTNFTVKPNKEEYQVIKHDSFMPEFDGSTTFKRVSVKADGFVRYLLNLVDFDAIEPADNKYLIVQLLLLYNVAGYVSSVGRTNHLKSGSTNLDFHLANHRGQSIRVTLWGNLEEVLVEKKTKQVGACPIVLASASPKIYNNKVYLSSTSSTVILNDAEIPLIKALKDANSGAELKNPYTPTDLSWPMKGTIENTLMWARNWKTMTKTGWNVPSCDSEGCRKGATRQKGYFFCESCNRRVDLPMLSAPPQSADDHVGLLAAISNLIGTTHVMEIKSQSYYEYRTFEIFTCWQLNPEEVCGDSVGSNMLDALDGVQTHRLVIEDSDVEASSDSSGYVGRNKADPMSDSNKKNRVVTKVSSEDVSGLHKQMHPWNSVSYDGWYG